MNVSGASWYGAKQAFANIARNGGWQEPAQGWRGYPGELQNEEGYPKSWKDIKALIRNIGTPTGNYDTRAVPVKCTWKGSGTVTVREVGGYKLGDHQVEFTLQPNLRTQHNRWIEITAVDDADPFRDLDCRDTERPAIGSFSEEQVNSLKGYGVLRFMDWSGANGLGQITWATRPKPIGLNGTAVIEHQMELARLVDADPWVNIHWMSDAAYNEGFAKLVHSLLPANHKVYVELSNETWNYAFPQARQAYNEGVELKLNPTDPYTGALWRYSDKSVEIFKVWTEVFKDNPKQLVRIVNVQSANPWAARQVINRLDNAKWFDAVAGAPYFGGGVFKQNPTITNPDEMIKLLPAEIDQTMKQMKETCDGAHAKNLRCITYEGGQHMYKVTPDVPANAIYEAVQRHPGLEAMYDKYLSTWYSFEPDLFTIYLDIGGISQYGAWGHKEFDTQPLSEAPKQRSIEKFKQK